VIATTVAFGMLGIFFPMTLFLQGALGFSPIRAGLTMTPMSVMIMVAAPLAGRLTDRIGARWILVTGLTLMTGGILFIISRITTETTWRSLLPALLVTGAGMGMTFAPMTAAAMAEVPPRIAGSASGILNTMRNVGQVLGIAVLGSTLQSRLGVHASDRLSGLPLDQGLLDRVVGLVRDSRFDAIAPLIPRQQIPVVLGTVQQAFVDSLHDTFYVGAFACLLAAATAFLIRKPVFHRTPVVAAARQADAVERVAAAD
jgi:MFS family permease